VQQLQLVLLLLQQQGLGQASGLAAAELVLLALQRALLLLVLWHCRGWHLTQRRRKATAAAAAYGRQQTHVGLPQHSSS
jgi:hypothetical protein